MKIVLVTYDLDISRNDDNTRVKQALESYGYSSSTTVNVVNNLPTQEPYNFRLPNTTVLANVDDSATTQGIFNEVEGIIKAARARVSRMYVVFIEQGTGYIFNE